MPPPEDPDITPSLFAHPDQVTSFKKISDLKMEMEQTDIDNYVEKFETGVKDDVLLIGDISLEEVQVGDTNTDSKANSDTPKQLSGPIFLKDVHICNSSFP